MTTGHEKPHQDRAVQQSAPRDGFPAREFEQVPRMEPCEIRGEARVAECAPRLRFAVSGLLSLIIRPQ